MQQDQWHQQRAAGNKDGDEEMGSDGEAQAEAEPFRRFTKKQIKDAFKSFCVGHARTFRNRRPGYLKEANADCKKRLESFRVKAKKAADRVNRLSNRERTAPASPPASLATEITKMPWTEGFATYFKDDARKQDHPMSFFIGMAAMSVPMASVEPERCFSILRCIKRPASVIARQHAPRLPDGAVPEHRL